MLEAMAAGIPYLAGDNDGYRATTADMADRLLIDPKQIEAFADKIEELLFDTKQRKLYKSWAKKHVKQYDYKNIVKKYEKLFTNTVKANK